MKTEIFTTIVLWGIWGLTEKIALFSGTPYQTIFAFYVWTALLFLPFGLLMVWRKKELKISRRVWAWIFLAVMTDMAAMLCLRFALQGTLTGVVLATTASYPVIAAVLSKLFLDERITRTQFLGIILACVGVFIISI
jgi:drug/metabolite transporter (DMT)-like permease